jgi:hypothetical protein
VLALAACQSPAVRTIKAKLVRLSQTIYISEGDRHVSRP